jgi:hypothetical protein
LLPHPGFSESHWTELPLTLLRVLWGLMIFRKASNRDTDLLKHGFFPSPHSEIAPSLVETADHIAMIFHFLLMSLRLFPENSMEKVEFRGITKKIHYGYF